MANPRIEEAHKPVRFGRRRVRPWVCIVDDEHQIRALLRESLEELGFVACECTQVSELATILTGQTPDLVILGAPAGETRSAEVLRALAAGNFKGKVLLHGPSHLPVVTVVRKLAEELGLAILPTLSTPFARGDLRDSVAALLPIDEPPPPPVDLAEAISSGWLELWYQPKVDARTLSVRGAEALVRMRHPTWGVVPPAYFIPEDGDPHFRALSEFVIGRAVDDWRRLVVEHGHIEIAINLPIDFLQDRDSIRSLCRQMPDHPDFKGLIIETNGTEILRNLKLIEEVSRQVRLHNIGLSIDDVGAEWPSFSDISDFPFVEIKVDQKFVNGCAEDCLKQLICRRISNFAHTVGIRTVAEGVETRSDFRCVREMGFDMVQGFLFAKPMPAPKFERTVLSHRADWPSHANVRPSPERHVEATSGDLPFSPDLVPVMSHDLVRGRDFQSQKEILGQKLHEYLRFMSHLEYKAVLPACAMLGVFEGPIRVTEQIASEGLTIAVDEAHHALSSEELKAHISELTGIRPFREHQPRFLRELSDRRQSASGNHSALVLLTFSCVSETMVTSTLTKIPSDARVLPAVREAIAEHARDEARHHQYFSQIMSRMWEQLRPSEKDFVGPLFAEFILGFLAPDSVAELDWLEAAGFEQDEAQRIIEETYDGADLNQMYQEASKPTMSLMREFGMLEHPATHDAFASMNLL